MIESKENSCAFYASDYHLEMIMLPYINENFKNNKTVYVFTQNNLTNTVNTLMEKVNLEKETKQKIMKINWAKDDETKYKKLIEDNNESLIFVKGDEQYIKKVNNNLKQLKDYKGIEVIDCYNLNDINGEVRNISTKYGRVLKTLGK